MDEVRRYFEERIKNSVVYRNYWRLDYLLFKKFIYLQLFRAHVSNLDEFADVRLTLTQLEIIKESLKNNFTDLKVLIFATDLVKNKSSNPQFVTFLNGEKDSYIMWINEFIYIIFLNDNKSKLFENFEEAYTYEGSVRICLLDEPSWENFKQIWYREIKNE